MTGSGAAALPPEVGVGSDEPLAGIEYLDAWRWAHRPFPGSVPPLAGFSPIDLDRAVPTDDDDADDLTTVVATAIASIRALISIDPSFLDPQALATLTEGVEQTRHAVTLVNAFREDEVKESYDSEKALSNAPDKEGSFFKVPKIIE